MWLCVHIFEKYESLEKAPEKVIKTIQPLTAIDESKSPDERVEIPNT